MVLPFCAIICMRNFYPPPGPEEDFALSGAGSEAMFFGS